MLWTKEDFLKLPIKRAAFAMAQAIGDYADYRGIADRRAITCDGGGIKEYNALADEALGQYQMMQECLTHMIVKTLP
jgi:hypothetical protein